MKLLILTLLLVATLCSYSDLSDSFTDLLLSLSSNKNSFNQFQNKLGNLAQNIDSKSSSNSQVQSSVIDLFTALEGQAQKS